MKMLAQLFINLLLVIGIFAGCCVLITLLLALLRFPFLLIATLLTGWILLTINPLLAR